MRKFLYGRWFFFVLALACAVDLIADPGEQYWGRNLLNMLPS
jgi:hypothetical protein